MATATLRDVDVTVTTTPTLEQMKMWWAALQQDPTRYHAYTDLMPTELEDFLLSVRRGDITVYMFLVRTDADMQIGGAFYLHDAGSDRDGPYTWLGAYILPAYRGRMATRAWQILKQQCAQQGLHRMFAAIRHSNRPAQCFITHQMGFTRLGAFVDWSYFAGRLDTVILYTLWPEDQGTAWVSAERRAQRARARRSPVRQGDPVNLHLSVYEHIAYDRIADVHGPHGVLP
jgi:L-amino acid N-acyltransferase YncA